jgi:hypothetical protein
LSTDCSDDLNDVIETPAPTYSQIVIADIPCSPPSPPPPPPGIPPPSPPTPPPPPGSTEVKLSVTAVTSDGDDGNVSTNVNDGSLDTRWSKLGLPAWVQLDMGLNKTLSYVRVAWYKGETGRIYGFNIQTSSNASTWTTVYTGSSMGNTAQHEMYNFPDVSCRYVRLNVTSNNQTTSAGNVFASVTEVELWGIGSGSEIPPPPPTPPPPGAPPGSIDTDGVKILNTIDTTPGKFHCNIPALNLTGSTWGSSSRLEVDADGSGQKNVVGGLTYWAFTGREGSFASSGARNVTTRLDYVSTTGSTICGVSEAKSRGTIGRENDTKNAEITAIFRVRNVLNSETQQHYVSLKPRGDNHGGSNECTLQVGGRHPYSSNSRGRPTDLYGVEYTHPNYDMQNVTFVSPFTSTNYPTIPHNTWFGIKVVIYNVNNNQTVHFEMWVDTNPVSASGTFNNTWQKVWVFEHSGSMAPTWAGPHCQLRTNLAENLDIAAYNIHEIIPPTSVSTIMSAEELAEKAEYEQNTGMTYPMEVTQIEEIPIESDPNTFVPDDELASQQIQQEGLVSHGNDLDVWRRVHGIATASDLSDTGEELASSSDDSKEITEPEFIRITTSERTESPKKYKKIKKIKVAKEPKPKELEIDEGDEDRETFVPLPPPPTPDEADPITALTRVTKSITLKYNAVGRVTNSKIIKYNIGGLIRVTRSMVLKYSIKGRTKRFTIIKYNLGQTDEFEDTAFDTTSFA